MCKRCKTNQVSIVYTTHTWALDDAILQGECYDGKINPVSTLQRALVVFVKIQAHAISANQICTQCIQRDLGELCNQCVGLGLTASLRDTQCNLL